MEGQELDSLSLNELIELESKHTEAFQSIFHVRTKRQLEETDTRNVQLQQLKLENQRLEVPFSTLPLPLSANGNL
jgi:hypothetical protein